MCFQATSSLAVMNVLITLFTIIGFLIAVASVATASRLIWAFARDNALLGSIFIRKIDSKQKIPINAVAYNIICIAALGCLYVISSTGKFVATVRKK